MLLAFPGKVSWGGFFSGGFGAPFVSRDFSLSGLFSVTAYTRSLSMTPRAFFRRFASPLVPLLAGWTPLF